MMMMMIHRINHQYSALIPFIGLMSNGQQQQQQQQNIHLLFIITIIIEQEYY